MQEARRRALITVVAVLGLAGPASADDQCRATTDAAGCYFRAGQALLDASPPSPREAAARFLTSYRLDPSKIDPLGGYGIALARDGQYVLAAEAMEKALEGYDARAETVKRADASASVLLATIAEHREVVADVLAEIAPHVSRVTITSTIPDGTVIHRKAPGELRPSSPLRIVVTPHADVIVVRFATGQVEEIPVEVAPGATVPLALPAPRATQPDVVPPPLITAAARGTRTWVGVGVGAIGVAALGAAALFQVQSSKTWDDALAAGCNEAGSEITCPQGEATRLGNRSNSQATRALISAIAGGALVTAGLVLIVTDKGTRATPTTASVVPVDAGAMVMLGGSF